MLLKTSRLTLALMAGLMFMAQSSNAQIIFEDGGVNVVDSELNNYILVRDSAEGAATTVLIQTGAVIPSFDPDDQDTSIILEGNSTVDMSDGMTVGGFNTYDNSTGILTAGIVGDEVQTFGDSIMTIGVAEGDMAPEIQDDLESADNSIADMYDGFVFDDVEATGSAIINLFGGEYDEDVEAFDNSTINVFGGLYNTGFGDPEDIEGGKMEAENFAVMNIYGGSFVGALFDPDIEAENDGVINIYGTDFAVDGSPVGFGPLAAATGQLTGMLSDGSLLDNDFEHMVNGGIINLIEAKECGFELGDVNEDGSVDLLDVNPFVGLLTDGVFLCQADINGDGNVDLLDVNPFAELLSGG